MKIQTLFITFFYSVFYSMGILFTNIAVAQVPFYQDFFYGGVTGDGFNPAFIDSPGSLDISIEPGSSIRRAFLFATLWKQGSDPILDRELVFNGIPFTLSEENGSTGYFTNISVPSNPFHLKILAIDVTDMVNPAQTSYLITPPPDQGPTADGGIFMDYYLWIAYENPLLSKINTLITLNNYDCDAIVNYSFSNLNPIDLAYEVGFTFNATAFCDTTQDGSYVYTNGNLLGLTGGDEAPGVEPSCTGVRGSFYYQNNTLFGLDNDTPDAFMSGVEALANIQSFITDPTQFDVTFEYQTPPGGEKTNPVLELFTTYSTSCDTFSVSVPNDTIVCQGTQLQLQVSGGTSIGLTPAYEWFPSTGLSCDTCPDPIFTADSSMNYTVRIWNNDSCSVVRPLQILVNPLTIDSFSVVSPDCGASNGSISLYNSIFQSLDVDVSVNGDTISSASLVNNLPEGFYTLSLIDEMGCTGNSINVQIIAVNNTVAQFGLDPTVGNVPLDVTVYQLSQNATNYAWYVNNTYVGDQLSNYIIQNGGDFTFELIAWQYDPSCADTFALTVLVSELIIPTAFTPDGDNINDTWVLLGLDKYFPNASVQVYNRWGGLIFVAEDGMYTQNPWDGTYNGEVLPVGSYYYIIEPNKNGADKFNGTVSILLN